MTLDPYNALLHREDSEPANRDHVDWTIAVKDLIDVAGMPTRGASKVLNRVATEDAECVAPLRRAGARIIGKANTHEFGYGTFTNSPHFGPALNPWNRQHVAGGSSGGSAAAVAGGLCVAALGTDTAGSIRVPAAYCGVTGLRPTTGIVPTGGVIPLSPTFDTVGPLARDAEECARLLEAISGRPIDLTRPADLRIGFIPALFDRADARVASACREAMKMLPGRLEPIAIPAHDAIGKIVHLIQVAEATSAHLDWLRTRLRDYGDDVRARLLLGLFLPATAYVTALRGRRSALLAYEQHLARYDLIVAPTMPTTAPRLDTLPPDFRAEQLVPYNAHWTLFGCPALTLPCGVVDGLPVGLCVAGRPHEDGLVLATGRAFQEDTAWHLGVAS